MTRKRNSIAEAALTVAAGVLTGVLLAQISLPDFHLARAPWHSATDARDSLPSRPQPPASHRDAHPHFLGHTVTTAPAQHSTRNL